MCDSCGWQIFTLSGACDEASFLDTPFTLSGDWGPRTSAMSDLAQAKALLGQRVKDVRIAGSRHGGQSPVRGRWLRTQGEPLAMICRLRGVADVSYAPGTIHSVLAAHIRAHSPISPNQRNRIRATDLPLHVWSQYGTLQRMWTCLAAQRESMCFRAAPSGGKTMRARATSLS